MEISAQPAGSAMEIQVRGRLDNTWSDFFATSLDRIVAEGAHDLRVDLSEVTFLSSAGIGVLVRSYNQLRSVAGTFVVVRPSARVIAILRQTALETVLCGSEKQPKRDSETAVPRSVETATAAYDLYELAAPAPLRCRMFGAPGELFHSAFSPQACHPLGLHRFAVGLGALGSGFEECQERFGEFIAVEGATAYQPTEAASPPDYLICTGGNAGEAQMLYGLACDGGFQQLVRFEARKQVGPLPLSDLVQRCLEFNGAAIIGMVIIAEVAGLVGAALRRSPALSNSGTQTGRPAVSQWLSFSPERSHQRTVALAAGVASCTVGADLIPFLRPMAQDSELQGHFHAAAFSYLPVQRGIVQLGEAVKHVFESQSLLSVLHLLNDTRSGAGIGQSEFVRGACWIAAVSETLREAA